MSARARSFSDSSCLRASNSEDPKVSVFCPGLVLSRTRVPSLNLMTDAGQICREEALSAQQPANGFVGGLRLQVDLEFLIGTNEAAFLRARFGRVGQMVVGHGVGGCCDRLRRGDAPGRPPGSLYHLPACHLAAYWIPLVRSRTQQRRGILAAGHTRSRTPCWRGLGSVTASV
jgi:hypothetical protein